MMQIYYTSSLIFLIILVLYIQIFKKDLSSEFIRYLILKKRNIEKCNNIESRLNINKIYFKTSSFMKGNLLSLMTSICIAFILYNYLFFTVPISNSMYPTFEKGDLVLMQKYDLKIHEGDIIMFGAAYLGEKSRVITHRVYGLTPKGIQTKGDATPVDNWIIDPKNVHAKAITINGEPIVLKSIGHYFLNTQLSSVYSKEFGFLQSIFREAKKLGLLIFAICITLFGLLTINDSIKHRKLRNRHN